MNGERLVGRCTTNMRYGDLHHGEILAQTKRTDECVVVAELKGGPGALQYLSMLSSESRSIYAVRKRSIKARNTREIALDLYFLLVASANVFHTAVAVADGCSFVLSFISTIGLPLPSATRTVVRLLCLYC